MNFAEKLLQFAERVGHEFKSMGHRVSALESRLDQEILTLSIQMRTMQVQTAFPSLPTEQINLIDESLRFAAQHSSMIPSEILDLLTRQGNVIWDLQHRWRLFQDVAGTTPVTEDNQPVRLVKPWRGSNNLVLDGAYSPLISNQVEGALFPHSLSVAKFSRRSDLKFVLAAITPDLSGSAFGTCWILGDTFGYDCHPEYTDARLFSETYGPKFAHGGIWIDGQNQTNDRNWPSTTSLVTLRPIETFSANSIAEDRTYANELRRSYYGRARLYFLSSEDFSSPEIEALNQFGLFYAGLVA